MFNECFSLQNLNLFNFNTKNVTNMASMFGQCCSLTNLNLINFNTQKVTNMCYKFNSCSSLSNINLSNFNTQNVNNMCYMFCLCNSLANIDLSSFNIQNVIDMRYMFYGCKLLSIVNLFNFETKKDINMNYMFYECLSLKNIKNIYASISKIQNQIDINNIFYGCDLSEIQNEEPKNINLENLQISNNEDKEKKEDEIKDEVKEEIKEEIKDEIKEDVKDEVKNKSGANNQTIMNFEIKTNKQTEKKLENTVNQEIKQTNPFKQNMNKALERIKKMKKRESLESEIRHGRIGPLFRSAKIQKIVEDLERQIFKKQKDEENIENNNNIIINNNEEDIDHLAIFKKNMKVIFKRKMSRIQFLE